MKKCCNFSKPTIIISVIVLFIIILSGVCIWKVKKISHFEKRGGTVACGQTQQDALIKNEVQSAVSVLQVLADKTTSGELTMTAAQKMGADILRTMRYSDGTGYFWADTKEGTNVVLYGDKTVEGTNRFESQANGIFYVKKIIEAGLLTNGGYADYFYHKPNETVNKAKRSFSLYFAPFNWVVGTGYYLEDVNSGCSGNLGGKCGRW